MFVKFATLVPNTVFWSKESEEKVEQSISTQGKRKSGNSISPGASRDGSLFRNFPKPQRSKMAFPEKFFLPESLIKSPYWLKGH
jgi:hypothetical protein